MSLPAGLTNDLLPFATGAGSNVLPQSSWTGLPGRLTGFVSGVAESAHLNKAWRQSAFTSAMIGQFTARNSNQNVLDDGDVDEYEDQFTQAIKAAVSMRRTTLGGTANAATAAFSPPFLAYPGIFFLVDVSVALEDDATLKVDNLPVLNLLRDDGTRIQKGDAPVGAALFVAHDGTGLRVLNMTPYSVQSGSTNYAPLAKVTGTANSVNLAMNPPVFYYREGAVYRFMPALANTGPMTVALNALAPKPLTEMDGNPFIGGEVVPGSPMWFMDAGANFVFLRFSSYLSNWARPLPGFFFGYAAGMSNNTNYTTLANSVWTRVNVGVEQADVEGWFNPASGRYTPGKAGFYYFTADCSFGSSGDPTVRTQATHGIRVFMNGTPTFHNDIGDVPGNHYAGAGNGARGVVSGITYANGSTDFYEPYAFQDFLDTSGFRRAWGMRWGGWFLGR